MKRIFDILFSLHLLFILAPVLFIITLILKFTGEGEVFYTQERVGLNGNNFIIFKFATMLKDSENMTSGSITLKDDPRVLFFGAFLRKYKLNELPQLVNVLAGDMSIVGPRPLTESTSIYLPKKYRKLILKFRPGLTGLASLFFAHEENLFTTGSKKSHEMYKDKIGPIKAKIEDWYCKNQSFYLDFKIIIATIIKVCLPKFNLLDFYFTEFTSTHFYNELLSLTEGCYEYK